MCNGICEGCGQEEHDELDGTSNNMEDERATMLDLLLNVVHLSPPDGLNEAFVTICAVSGRYEQANKILKEWVEAKQKELQG